MSKLRRSVLIAVSTLLAFFIGITSTSQKAMANTTTFQPQRSCVLLFRKIPNYPKYRYRSGNCSQTTTVAIVTGEDNPAPLNEGEGDTRFLVSSWLMSAEQSSRIINKYLGVVKRCDDVLCKTVVGIDAILSGDSRIFTVYDLNIETNDNRARIPNKSTDLASEVLCSSAGGIVLISRDNVAGDRFESLSIVPVGFDVCKEIMGSR